MDIGQPRPSGAAVQQNAGNNPVVTQEADRSHHQQTTSQKIHTPDKVRISPDARDYLKREQDLAESQLKTTTRQFSGVEHSPQDLKVMERLQSLSNSSELEPDAIHGIGMFEIDGLEPIVGIVGDLTAEQQIALTDKVSGDDQIMNALRELPGKPLPQEAVQEILPALSAGRGDIQKMSQVLMRLMLETMLSGLQGQLAELNTPLDLESKRAIPQVQNENAPGQSQRLKASIVSVESQLAHREGRQPRQDIVSGG